MPSILVVRVVFIVAALVMAAGGNAQRAPANVPFDLHDGELTLDPTGITFCIDTRNPDVELHRAVGEALADALLLEPRFFEFGPEYAPRLEQLVGIPENLLFILLDDKCEAFLGVRLHERSTHPDFVFVTRTYVDTGYVLVTSGSGATGFESFFPRDDDVRRKLGVPVASPMNLSVSLFQSDVHRRVYPTERELLEGLRNGEVDGGLFLETTLHGLTGWDTDSLDFNIVTARPLPATAWSFGLSLMNTRTYTRTLLDDAIAAITEDGTIKSILDELGLSESVATGRVALP